jgi:hypothetical protein
VPTVPSKTLDIFNTLVKNTVEDLTLRRYINFILFSTFPSFSDEYVEWMKNLVEFFLQDEKYQVDESKRVKNKKSAAKQLEKTQVSLQKLELD